MRVFQDVDPSVRYAEMRRGLEEQMVIRQQISAALRETIAMVKDRQARDAERLHSGADQRGGAEA